MELSGAPLLGGFPITPSSLLVPPRPPRLGTRASEAGTIASVPWRSLQEGTGRSMGGLGGLGVPTDVDWLVGNSGGHGRVPMILRRTAEKHMIMNRSDMVYWMTRGSSSLRWWQTIS